MRDLIMPRAREIKNAWTIGHLVEIGRAAKNLLQEDIEVDWDPTAETVANVKSAPPVDNVLDGKVNDWAMIALIKSVQKSAGLQVSGKYNQKTAEFLNTTLSSNRIRAACRCVESTPKRRR